jgi:hypothetical protein
MKRKTLYTSLVIGTIFTIAFYLFYKEYFPGPAKIASFKVNPDSVNISIYWKSSGGHIKNISK